MPLLDEAAIRITEAARELARYAESLDMDNARQAVVEKRLAAAEDLARKHRVAVADLPAHRATLRIELEALESAEQDVASLRRQQAEALTAYRDLAVKLSESRTAIAVTFSKEITARMHTLGMAGGRFQVDVTPHASAEPQPHGLDQIEFRVTANPGQPLRALAKVASGGELARLSLAVQVACVGDERRCMVFDEVDAGIGGAVAEVVGKQLRASGRTRPGAVCHPPAAGGRAGTSPPARAEAHRWQDHAHQPRRTQRQRTGAGSGTHAGWRTDHRQGPGACAGDAVGSAGRQRRHRQTEARRAIPSGVMLPGR